MQPWMQIFCLNILYRDRRHDFHAMAMHLVWRYRVRRFEAARKRIQCRPAKSYDAQYLIVYNDGKKPSVTSEKA